MKEQSRVLGLDFLPGAPWGTHLCQFYETKEDLIDTLVPYFKAGLENNEFCMWVTAEPLGVEDAKATLGEAVENLDDYAANGQIEILDYSQWYTRSGKFHADELLQGWVEKLNQALERGFDGLRLTGNTFWLEKKDWDDFAAYEAAVDNVIGKYRILAICSYSLDKCGSHELIDVVQNHEFAIIRRHGKWEIFESTGRKRAEEALRDSGEQLRIRNKISEIFLTTPDEQMYAEVLRVILEALKSEYGTFGYFREDGAFVVPAMTREIYWEKCNVPEKDIIFEHGRFSGIWSRALNERKILCSNKGPFNVPEGHIPIKNTMATPIIYQDEIISAIHIANKATDYDEKDQALLKTIAEHIAPVLNARLQRDRQDKERKLAEERLQENEECYRTLAENLPGTVYRVFVQENNRTHFFNNMVPAMTGYRVEELQRGEVCSIEPHIIIQDRAGIVATVRNAIMEDKPFEVEYRFKHKDGSIRYFFERGRPIRGKDGKPLYIDGVIFDNTERKHTEEALRESEEMFRLTFENAVDAIIWAEPDTGLVINCNKAAETLLEKRRDEIIGEHQTKLHPPQKAEYYREMFKKHIERKRCFDVEAQVVTKFGKIIPVHITASVTLVGEKPIIQGIFRDITERKRVEEQIEASLKEKEVLLREIHHRVKNNMQVIASLLRLQCRGVKDDRVKALLEESENRVNAMVIVQELLYESESLAEIDVKKYINKLIDSIFKSCRLGGQVTWKSEVEAATLSIDQAAPFGLVLSEILTNSLKHGFPQGGPGKITVRLRLLENEQVELVIRDNGSGLSERIDIRNTKTLGLRLVTGLIENQLGGVVELSRKKGTQFTIRFPQKAAQG